MISDPSVNVTFFNTSFVPRQPPPWIITIPESQRITFIVCYALILVWSVVGNTSIIAIVARNPSLRSTINYLIANMAASDLAASVVVTARVFSIFHNLSMEFEVSGVLGNMFCRLAPYIQDISISVSILSIVAIAVDRFYAVVFPMTRTPRLLDLRVLLPIIWCLSLGTFTVHLVNFKLISPIQGVDVCIQEWPTGVDSIKASTIFYLSIFTVFWLVPLTTIAILYTIIALKMRHQTIPGQQSSDAEQARRKRNKSIAKMAFAIVFFFFLCWFPFHTISILKLVVWKGSIPNGVDPHLLVTFHDTTTMISYVSFVVNPYVCLTFSSKLRKCFRNLFPFSLCFATRISPLGVSSQWTSNGTSTTGQQKMVRFNRTTSQAHRENKSKTDSR
ncbi:QRFP-like peptide receptor [Actinia tenebrosa]|uniref:QRFP-like peptide receptor n=1 Tax=Actinia tenebrosa TaxID=6105 RepID=A0A6P8I1T8_ACTTE|nr:QRFP-like peptide receptor [Actinia tenebrosa]